MSSPTQWRHVTSENNLANIASRGTYNLGPLRRWLTGPKFLLELESNWPPQPRLTQPDGVELKSLVAQANRLERYDVMCPLMSRFSCWMKLQKVVAWLLRYRQYLLIKTGRARKEALPSGVITVSELRQARNCLIKIVQSSHFAQELNQVNASVQDVKRPSNRTQNGSLRKLSPVLIDGILCVGGRLSYSNYSQSVKHSALLPSRHSVTALIIRHFHEVEGHCGVSQVLASTRQRYWIINGTGAVKREIGACSLCRRRSAQP
ncbi:hypothetical protein CLF_101369, partial [Clonorchis sinensis]